MAKIVVNGDLKVNGKVTFRRVVNEDKSGFVIEGIFSTHLYFENITSLDMSRFALKDIEVYEEDFGSDDYNILYHFKAKSLKVFGAEEKGVYYVLYGEEMKMIEEEMYKDSHPTLGAIGKEYALMVVEETKEEEKEE